MNDDENKEQSNDFNNELIIPIDKLKLINDLEAIGIWVYSRMRIIENRDIEDIKLLEELKFKFSIKEEKIFALSGYINLKLS